MKQVILQLFDKHYKLQHRSNFGVMGRNAAPSIQKAKLAALADFQNRTGKRDFLKWETSDKGILTAKGPTDDAAFYEIRIDQ